MILCDSIKKTEAVLFAKVYCLKKQTNNCNAFLYVTQMIVPSNLSSARDEKMNEMKKDGERDEKKVAKQKGKHCQKS